MSSPINLNEESTHQLKRVESHAKSLGSLANMTRRKSTGISDVSHFTQRRMSSALNGPQWSLMASLIDGSTGERSVSPVNTPRGPVDLSTGSRYDGAWDNLGMTGRGVYTMPHGVQYTGDLHDNCFKGSGHLLYSDGALLKVVYRKEWNENLNDSVYRMTKVSYVFKDELQYTDDWQYCTTNDRRFHVETQEGLQPVCTERRTQRQPTPTLPPGCYDAGEGVYNPLTRCLTDHDTGAIIRIPTAEEHDWIIKNCRTTLVVSVGYRPDLYENWVETPGATTMTTPSETEECLIAERVDQRLLDVATAAAAESATTAIGINPDSSKTSVTTGHFSMR